MGRGAISDVTIIFIIIANYSAIVAFVAQNSNDSSIFYFFSLNWRDLEKVYNAESLKIDHIKFKMWTANNFL